MGLITTADVPFFYHRLEVYQMKKTKNQVVSLNLKDDVIERADKAGKRLGLPRSEILRRAVIIGLPSFDSVTLPGSIHRNESQAEAR